MDPFRVNNYMLCITYVEVAIHYVLQWITVVLENTGFCVLHEHMYTRIYDYVGASF